MAFSIIRGGKKNMIYTHWIIENNKTGERDEIIVKGKRAPRNDEYYKIIGCCGYHEKPHDDNDNAQMEE